MRHGYLVQGDNRRYRDDWRPTPANIVGSVWLRVPKVGLVIAVARERQYLPVIAALVGFVWVLLGSGFWTHRVHGQRAAGAGP